MRIKKLQDELHETNRRLEYEVAEKERQRSLLAQETLFGVELNRFLALDQKLQVVARWLPELMQVSRFSLFRFAKGHKSFRCLRHNHPELRGRSLRLRAGSGTPMDDAVARRRAVIVSRRSESAYATLADEDGLWSECFMAVPLMIGDRPIGVVNYNREGVEGFSTQDLERAKRLSEMLASSIENAELYGEVQRLSHTDRLTALNDHNYFFEQLAREMERCRRYGTQLACMMIDIDNFKALNDTRGHLEGDRLLCKFADVVMRSCRQSDVPARYGGDEFAVLLPGADRASAEAAAERLCRRADEEAFAGEAMPAGKVLGISVGIATFPADGDTPEELVKAADDALYAAKGTRGRVTR